MNQRSYVITILLLTVTALLVGVIIYLFNAGIPYDSIPASKTINVAIPPEYELARNFSNSRAAVRENGRWGYINTEGKWVHRPEYSAALDYHDGLAPVQSEDKWGYVNRSGTVVIRPQYERAVSFHQGRAAVQKNSKWGFIDMGGDTVTDHRYDYVESFQNGFAVVQDGDRKKFIDRSGEFVFDKAFSDAHGFQEGLAPVEKDDLWGYINRHGELVQQYRYQWGSSFKSKHARVLTHAGWKLINRQFETRDLTEYELIGSLINARAPVIQGESWGFIDGNGNRLRPETDYDAVIPFHDGSAPVKRGAKWGYINSSGDTILDPSLDAAGQFHEGFARFKVDGEWGFLTDQPRDDEVFDTSVIVEETVEGDTRGSLETSLSEEFPEWFYEPGQRYVSIGRGVLDRRWHLEITSPTESYGFNEVLYEVTKYPYQFPTAVQHEAAEELYYRSLEAVEQNGWFEFQNALDEGFEQNKHDATHFHHLGNSTDSEVLVPGEPEYLIYYGEGKDQRLTGFMYLNSSLYGTGPQVGGNLTKWHYHRYSSDICFRNRLIIQHEADDCPDGKWQRRAPEMLHIWFIEHPQGSHATRMQFFEDRVPKSTRDYNPKLTN